MRVQSQLLFRAARPVSWRLQRRPDTFPPGGIKLNGSPAHRHIPVCNADQERLSPSSSSYFGIAGQDTRSVFSGMGDDAMHHIINDGSTADDMYTQEEGETVVNEEEEGG
jgi:hypothetical protein